MSCDPLQRLQKKQFRKNAKPRTKFIRTIGTNLKQDKAKVLLHTKSRSKKGKVKEKTIKPKTNTKFKKTVI